FKNPPLEKIRIGINVQEIRAEAFKDCALLKEIVIPDSVRALGNSVFMNCEELSKVILGNGIETIPSYAFHQCPKLEEIVIPYNVKTIMNNAFSNCVRFSKITIPQVTAKMDTSIFSYPDNVTIYGVKGSYAETFAKENEITFVINGTKATNVTLNKSSVLLKRGTSQQLSLTVVPINFTDKVTWKSSNENVAIVTENGRITAKDYGTAVITVTVGNLTSSCKVTVSANTIFLDKATNIEVECPEGSISNNISLQTKQLTEADQEYGKITDKIVDAGISPSNVKFDAYDISLVSEDGNTVQPTKAVKVHVPCTDGYKGENGKVYRVNENGTFTDMKAVYEDGYLIFETNYLSTYIITETELVTNPDVILGDVNRDGEVDIKDSALIKRYLAGWEVDIDLEPADMDDDKDVTIKDSALVKRQLAGW
ncbi:MAG: leucine-rich repeat protein, partial [Lachnospiraceae bacterium]|nr:leucine-rich repeat protein [Lachnospiraceae bacterium]